MFIRLNTIKMSNYVPVFPVLGKGFDKKILNDPDLICWDGPNDTVLIGPVKWGDRRPDGKFYHGGIYYSDSNTIVYHGKKSTKPRFRSRK